MSEASGQRYPLPKGVHIMAKPAGPACNLRCEYCFYLEKHALYPDVGKYRMSDEVLEAYIRKNIAFQTVSEVLFAWQGGEPTLLGVDFFRKAMKLQQQHSDGRPIRNTFQTNGILLNDEWCRFLAQHKFLVGLSLDGPEEIHNRYRLNRAGQPTYKSVMRALKLLQKHGVEYNILAVVTSESSKLPLDVYRFFKSQGVQFIQFIPIVEREPNAAAKELGLDLGTPPVLDGREESDAVTSFSVEPEAYGDFLIAIFDEWVRNDVGRMFVMNFEWALCNWAGRPAIACFFMPRCGNAGIIERNGDVYSCDHFVYPEYRIGNILTDELDEMFRSHRQHEFGSVKERLPRYCRECDVLFACWGECPKHRFTKTPDGEPGLNYLCAGYRKFFRHVTPRMETMAQIVQMGHPADKIMEMVREEDRRHGGEPS
jgi:uncharacterized protein